MKIFHLNASNASMGKGLGSLITKTVATGFKMEENTHTCFTEPCNQQLSEEDTHAARNMTSKKELKTANLPYSALSILFESL